MLWIVLGRGGVRARRVIRGLRTGNVGPASGHVLMVGALIGRRGPLDLGSLRRGVMSVSGSDVFHALALFLRRSTIRAFRSKEKVLGCRIYRRRKRYSRRSNRVRFCYRSYRHSFYVRSVRVPDFRLPRKFCPRSISFIVGKRYPRYEGERH